MRLLVGLGNPGAKYEDTRHNIGFRAIDQLVGSYGDEAPKLHPPHGAQALLWQHTQTKDILMKPLSFMNDSGVPVGIVANFYQIVPRDIHVFYDELDFTLGRWEHRLGGSSAGHKGVISLIEHVGSDQFNRYRLGIGTPRQTKRQIAAEDFVLQPFTPEEEEIVGKMLSEATTHLLSLEAEGPADSTVSLDEQ